MPLLRTSRVAVGLLGATIALAGCGGSDSDSGSEGLSEDQTNAVSEAVITINGCAGAQFGAEVDADEADAAASELADLVRDNPTADYTQPGRTETEPLIDVAQDAQETLTECPLGTGSDLSTAIAEVGTEANE